MKKILNDLLPDIGIFIAVIAPAAFVAITIIIAANKLLP